MGTLIRTLACGAAAAIATVSLGMQAAYAGEITGNGKDLRDEDGALQGRSICAFSGLNDTYTGDPDVPDEEGFTRTQNWGQIPKAEKEFLTSIGVNPGRSCNPNNPAPEE